MNDHGLSHPRQDIGETLWMLAVCAICTGIVAGVAYAIAGDLAAVVGGLATLMLFGMVSA